MITGSHSQGIAVLNNSHPTLKGVTVSGGAHGGLVASNLFSIDLNGAGNSTTQSLVGANSVDLFWDTGSMITGATTLMGSPTAQCANCARL